MSDNAGGEARWQNNITGESYSHDFAVPSNPIHTVTNQSHDGVAWTGHTDRVITEGPLVSSPLTLDWRVMHNRNIRIQRALKHGVDPTLLPDNLALELHERHGKIFAKKQKELRYNRTPYPLQHGKHGGTTSYGWVTDPSAPCINYHKVIAHRH